MMTYPKTLADDLVKDGISQDQADLLQTAYGTQPEFVAGLAAVVMLLALDEIPDQRPPQGEPWATVWDACAKDLTRKGEAWADYLTTLPADLSAVMGRLWRRKSAISKRGGRQCEPGKTRVKARSSTCKF